MGKHPLQYLWLSSGSFAPQRLYRVAIHHAHCVARESGRKLDPPGSFVARDTTTNVLTHRSRRQVVRGRYLYHSLNSLAPLGIWHAEHTDASDTSQRNR
jgi:hypothetical protein